jgi:hypothetical protein
VASRKSAPSVGWALPLQTVAEFFRRRPFGAHPYDTTQAFALMTRWKIPFRIFLETSCEFSGEQDMQTISSGTKAHIFRPSQPAVDARKMDPFARILPEAGLFSNNQPIKQREVKIKTRLLGALVGLAITFALPTFAQQTNAPNPQLREQMVALAKKI